MGLLSQKMQEKIRALRVNGRHADAVMEIISNFDATPLLSSGFNQLDAMFIEATNDLQAMSDSHESVYLSTMLLEKYAILSLFSGKPEVWQHSLSIIGMATEMVPEIQDAIEPFSIRFMLRIKGAEAALGTVSDIETTDGFSAEHWLALLELVMHSMRFANLGLFPSPDDETFQNAKIETKLWYSLMFELGKLLTNNDHALESLPDIMNQIDDTVEPIAEGAIIRAIHAGWLVLNGKTEQALDEITNCFGSINLPFWGDRLSYFPEVLYPVFWSEITMDQAEALLLLIRAQALENQGLAFPSVVAGLILIGLYGASEEYFKIYSTIRFINDLMEDMDLDASFLDRGIDNLEKIVGNATLMSYGIRYEEEL